MFFALFITCMVLFIVFASWHPTDLVRQDYYEEEIRYQQQLDRLNRTQPIRTAVRVRYLPARQLIRITLPAAHATPQTSGEIHFYRPSDAHLDHRLRLEVDAQGHQEVDARHLKGGLWKVRLQWKVAEHEYFFDQSIVVTS